MTMADDETFEHRLSPVPDSVDEARALLSHWLRSRAMGVPDRRDALIIASELCTAARGRTDNVITLRAEIRPDRLVVDVEDEGHGFAWAQGSDGSEGAPSGVSGLRLVASLVDEVSVEPSDSGTLVRSTKRLGA